MGQEQVVQPKSVGMSTDVISGEEDSSRSVARTESLGGGHNDYGLCVWAVSGIWDCVNSQKLSRSVEARSHD